MFVFRAETFLAELARQRPAQHAGLARIADAWDTDRREAVLTGTWPTLEKISVDYGVMEGAAAVGLVATVPGDFPWCDVGDFRSLGDTLDADDAGNVVVGADPAVLTLDAKDLIVVTTPGRLVAALGVDDLVIVDTPDAVLVCPRSRAQDVKQLVDSLRERGPDAYL
jgi:mannose-1-phosphate guanylyltransferase